jgi:hypothetical protein
MGDFAYTVVPGKLRMLLSKIRTVGVPPKVTIQWLKTIGFSSSDDKSLIGVLKFINFIDASGVPTQRWVEYRGSKYKNVLGDAVRQGYSDLFAVYPDANQRTQSELDHVFSTSSSGGKQVITKTIQTFKALVEDAEFSAESETNLHMAAGPLHTPPARRQETGGKQEDPTGPALHIDIQIHISPEASPEQIDQVFASMAKHVYGPRNG